MMKLLAHNFLSSHFLKNVTVGYPLKLSATSVNIREQEFNPEFIVRLLPKLDYNALRQAAISTGHGADLPEIPPTIAIPTEAAAASSSSESVSTENAVSDLVKKYDESFLKAVHRNLLEIEIVEGYLECPETGRQFPIKNAIPNMLANEDEVK